MNNQANGHVKAQNSLSSSLLSSNKYSGIKKILRRAGSSITDLDLSTCLDGERELTLERFVELSLALSLTPELTRRPLGEMLLDTRLFLFESEDGRLWGFLTNTDGKLNCIDVHSGREIDLPDNLNLGRAVVFDEVTRDGFNVKSSMPRWGKLAFEGTGNSLLAVLILTIVSNFLGLGLPLFTLAVYDQVLAAKSMAILSLLVAGLFVAVAGDFIVRSLRSVILSRMSSLIDLKTATALFGRLLRTTSPAVQTINARTGLMRLRDLDLIRNFFVGQSGVSCLEAPFSITYLVTLFVIGGWLALIPAVVLTLGALILLFALGPAARRGRVALQQSEMYGATCNEIARRLVGVQREGKAGWWSGRFQDTSARLAEAEMVRQRASMVAQIASSTLTSLVVVSTLAAGTLLVLDGTISVGILIASIAIVWRMCAPLPGLLQARLRWLEIKDSLVGTRTMLDLEVESTRETGLGGHGRNMAGRVGFSSVLFSYQRGYTAAVRNVSFEIAAGETIVITGPTGAGKSTILDLISGVIEPQFGSVTIDGINPRQISPSVLRQSIGYLTKDVNTLPISIEEYLRLGVDVDLHDEIYNICARLGILEELQRLPDGVSTGLSDIDPHGGLFRSITLARVLATDSKLILLDEPDASNLHVRQALKNELNRMKGDHTIILVTHEPEYIAIADRVFVFNQGGLIRICTPQDIAKTKEG